LKILTRWAYYAWSVIELLFGVRNWKVLFRIFLGKPTPELKWLQLRKSGIQMAVRGKMDVWSVKEALIDRFYQRYGSEIGSNWIIADVGAAIGEFTIPASLAAVEGRVLAFEPNPGSLDILRQNLRVNNVRNAQVFSLGVWSEAGNIMLDFSTGEPLQARSMAPDGNGASQGMPTITLEGLINEYAGGHLDLLKLDCEGAEYPILLSAPSKTLRAIDRVVMEYHDLDKERSHASLVRLFEANGFQVRLHGNFAHRELGYLYASRNLTLPRND
jgi:FkbM family methyltransferase